MIYGVIYDVALILLCPMIIISIYIWLWFIRIARYKAFLWRWGVLFASYLFLLSLALLWEFLLRKSEMRSYYGDWIFFGLLVPLIVFDNRYFLLPDPAVFSLLWLGILLAYLGDSPQALDEAILGVMFGYGVMWVIYWFGYACYRREAIGRGDLKLAAALGAWIGVGAIFNFLFISALMGLLWGIFVRCFKGEAKEEIPFGPSLGISGIIFYFIARFMATY